MTNKKAVRKVVISDLPVREKNLSSEEMSTVRGGGPFGGGGSKPGTEYVTQKYPSDGDDDLGAV